MFYQTTRRYNLLSRCHQDLLSHRIFLLFFATKDRPSQQNALGCLPLFTSKNWRRQNALPSRPLHALLSSLYWHVTADRHGKLISRPATYSPHHLEIACLEWGFYDLSYSGQYPKKYTTTASFHILSKSIIHWHPLRLRYVICEFQNQSVNAYCVVFAWDKNRPYIRQLPPTLWNICKVIEVVSYDRIGI
jgi:hypothetical protein